MAMQTCATIVELFQPPRPTVQGRFDPSAYNGITIGPETPMTTLLVFDYETTGPDPSRDRPVQFACVRTDPDLNMTAKPATLFCQPAPDHLPDPLTCLRTGITPQLCQELGLPELEFAGLVQRELATPDTISFGYDSIAFDDEITRFMFWRNLIDPYAREWKDGCGRWDLIGAVRAAWALRPEALEWPRDDSGAVSFELERLSAANGLLHESAHDALSDVVATLALARHIRDRLPQLYAHCFAMHEKTRALAEMDVASKTPFLYVGKGSAGSAGVRIMLPIAANPANRNEVVTWDLSQDPRQLLDIDAETMRRRLFTSIDERPEDFEAMPVCSIAANKSPVVLKNLNALSPERAAELGLDLGAALANAPVMLKVLEAVDVARLLQVVYTRDVYTRDAGALDAEEALYEGFIGSHDRRVLEQLRSMDAATLAALRPSFSDPRLDELLLRYKARHYPASLSQRELDKWEEHRFDKLITGYPGSRTVGMVRAAVAQCRQELAGTDALPDPASGEILDQVLAWTDSLAAVIDPFGTVAPAPPAPPASPVPVETAPAPVAVQPDLFGGADVVPGARRVRPRRR